MKWNICVKNTLVIIGDTFWSVFFKVVF